MATRGTGASPANLTKSLKGIDFPTDKQHLLQHAKQVHAEKIVLDEIQKMPEQQYSSMADVMKNFEPDFEQSKTRSSSSSGTRSSSSSGSSHSSSQRSSGQSGQSKSSSGGGRSSHK